MGLLDRLRGDFPHPAWRFATQGTLWQLHVGSPLFLLGEARNQEKKSVSFFSIDRISGTLHWEGLNPVGNWWVGVEGVFGEFVLFHGFATPDLPIHKGIFAVHGTTGSILWSEPGCRFLWCADGLIGACNPMGDSRDEILFDLKTGKGPIARPVERSLPSPHRERDEPAVYPRSLDDISESDPAAAEMVRSAIPSGAEADSVVGLLAGGSAIVEYAERRTGSPATTPAFQVVIAEIDRQAGRRRHTATVLSETAVARSEPFFVQGGMLFYVADRTTLVALPLRNL